MSEKRCVVLPINDKPSIITCIHYAYPCAIIESKELCILSIDNLSSKAWNEANDETLIIMKDDEIRVIQKETSSNIHALLWRECNQVDEVTIKVSQIKVHKKYIDIFLFADDLSDQMESEYKLCGVRWSLPGYTIQGKQFDYDTYLYKYVKLFKDHMYITCYGSIDGEEWTYLDKRKIPDKYKGEKLKVGLDISFGQDRYNEWKYMNFIQLTYNEFNQYKGIILDYYFYPRKYYDNSFSFFGTYLNTYYDILYEDMNKFESIHDLLHWNISNLYYVNICLDEYYVPERFSYQKQSYSHFNLFYGYNDEERVYYILGYGANSKPVISKLPYDNMEQKNVITSQYLVRYKYEPNCISEIRFNIRPVIRHIYEYINNIDSSETTCNLIPGERLQYGISILKLMAESEQKIDDICRDLRISFLLYERSLLMTERLTYLYNEKYINDEAYDFLTSMNQKLLNLSSTLMSLAIKSRFKKIEPTRVANVLIEIYENERKFFKSLLQWLVLWVNSQEKRTEFNGELYNIYIFINGAN